MLYSRAFYNIESIIYLGDDFKLNNKKNKKNKFIFLFFAIILLSSCIHSNASLPTAKSLDSITDFVEPLQFDFSFDEFSNTNVLDTTKDGNPYIYASVPYFSSDELNIFFKNFARNQIDDFINQDGMLLELIHDINFINKSTLNVKFNIKYTTDKSNNIIKNFYVDTNSKQIIDLKINTEEQQGELQNLATLIKTTLTNEYGITDTNNALESNINNFNNFYIDNQSKTFNFYFDRQLFDLEDVDNNPLVVNVPYKYLKHIAKSNMPDFYNQNRLQFAPDGKFISLTFDDGPHPIVTPAILDALKELNIKATFFLVGYCIDNNKDVAIRMFDEGHELANHTYSHKDLRKLSPSDMATQIDLVNAQIFDITGEQPKLFRPPYGFMDDNLSNTLKYRNMGLALWSVDPLDWKFRNKDSIKNHILSNTKNGSVILMHDIYTTTLEATLELAKELQSEGYEFLTMTELLSLEGSIEPGKRYRAAFENIK